MCLDKIDATYDKPTDLIVSGRKEFGNKPTAPKFQMMGGSVKLDQWMKADEIAPPTDIKAGDGKFYKAGFHVYDIEGSAPTLRRVYMRRVTCAGSQIGEKVLVAQELYVPSDPDAWPPQSTAPAPKNGKLARAIKKVTGGGQ